MLIFYLMKPYKKAFKIFITKGVQRL